MRKTSRFIIITLIIALLSPVGIFPTNSAKASVTITPMLAGGGNHTLALKASGNVWAWGYNGYGQLGDNTTTDKLVPVQVQNLTSATAIAGGNGHSLALKTDGTVWAWGLNDCGQLGDNTTANKPAPVQVQNLTGVIAIACGNAYSLALKSDGTVWSWGNNAYGQLGDNTTINKTVPVQVQNLTGVTAIDCKGPFSLALKANGTVWSWGYNGYGQLGDNTTINKLVPVQVQNLTGVTAIASGNNHSLALKTDGTVWSWGYNGFGQLGDNTTTNRLLPVQVQNLTGVTAITSGNAHSMALKTDGTVRAWGRNQYGQLGDNTTVNKLVPVQVQNLTGVNSIGSGNFHSLAVKTDGTVWAWGYNGTGQLGDNTTTNRLIPRLTLGPSATGYLSLKIAANGVTLDRAEMYLVPGATYTLTAMVLPENATNKNVVFTSSNTAIATVAASGLVTAVAVGNATITVTTVDGGYRAACKLSVSSALPFSGAGQGIETNPYIIENVSQLKKINNNLAACYKLGAEIDLENQYWQPIGNSDNPFTGGLDGAGYKIKNLKIKSQGRDVGLFSCTSRAALQNISIENVNISGEGTISSVGGLAGRTSNNQKIDNCKVEGTILINFKSTSTLYAGGLVGNNSSAITNSQVNGSLSIETNATTYVYAGGLIGQNSGTISGCEVKGQANINSTGGTGSAGGLIGSSSGTVTNNRVTAAGLVKGGTGVGGLIGSGSGTVQGNIANIDVEGVSIVGGLIGGFSGTAISLNGASGNVVSDAGTVGGLIGNLTAETTTIRQCYAAGNVESNGVTSQYTGGLIGFSGMIYFGVTSTPVNIENCFALGNVTGNDYVGGLVGSALNSSTLKTSYTIGTVKGNTNKGSLSGVTISSGNVTSCYDASKKATLIQKANGFDYTTPIWAIEEGATYSYLVGIDKPDKVRVGTETYTGTGTEADPYIIETKAQLLGITNEPGKCFALANDIDLDMETIGPLCVAVAFSGKLDGNNHVIKNVSISITGTDPAGLFGNTNGAVIKNLRIENISIAAPQSYAGSLVGSMTGGSIESCSVSGGKIDGSGSGGLIGKNSGGNVTDSTAAVEVSGNSYVGGLIGYNTLGGAITGSKFKGVVSSNTAGGLIGFIESVDTKETTISNSYVSGSIGKNQNTYTGGLVARVLGNGVTRISTSYANIDAGNSSCTYAGGLIGYYASTGTLTVENSFAAGTVQGSSCAGGIIGYSASTAVGTISCSYSLCQLNISATIKNGIAASPISVADSYFDQEKAGITTPVTQAKPSASMKLAATYTTWNTSKWGIIDGSYPYLIGLDQINVPVYLIAPVAVTISYTTPVSVKLTWDNQATAEQYEVSYNDKVESTTSPQIVINDLQPNTSYSFTVRALNYNMKSPWCAPVSATTLAETQLVPTNPAASAIIATSITVSWDAQAGAEGYEISYGTELLSVSTNSYVIEGLIPQTSYTFKVRSKVKNFASAWSTELTAATTAPSAAAGTLTDPYLIYTKDDLIAVNNHLASCYRLERDIDLQNQAIQPIGTADTPFTGKFNGNGHAISNLTINLTTDNVGLFGYTNQAEISDLKLNKVEIHGGTNVGALIGYMNAGSVANCMVTGVKGIIGTTDNGKIIGASGAGAQITNCIIESFILGTGSTQKQLAIVAGGSQLLTLNVSNMPRSAGKVYVLKYLPADINLTDLAAQTYELNTQPGIIPGTGIEIISNRGGIIRFTADQSRYTDKAWTGALTIIKFTPLKTDTTVIAFEME